MDLNFLPRRNRSNAPRVGAHLPARSLPPVPFGVPTLSDELEAVREAGFRSVVVSATGEAGGLHTPPITNEQRAELAEILHGFEQTVIEAPHQGTFDLTLVSPSPAIRRASVTELWSVCRFAQMVGADLVLVRTGLPPLGTGDGRVGLHLAESLQTLNKMADERQINVGVWNADRLSRLADLESVSDMGLDRVVGAVDVEHALAMGETVSELVAFVERQGDRLGLVRVPPSLAPGSPNTQMLADALTESGFMGLLCLTLPQNQNRYQTESDWQALVDTRRFWEQATGVSVPTEATEGTEFGEDGA